VIGFYNRDEKCLLRGANWVLNKNALRFVCKGLMFIFAITMKQKEVTLLNACE
jgi:hypothetical protein